MRKIAIIMLLLAGVCSCQNKIDTQEPTLEKVEIRFKVDPEAVDITAGEMNLSRASTPDNITAIQIYQRTADAGSKYRPFCYGLWDDLTKLSVMLNKGYIYRVELTTMPQGKQAVAMNDSDGSYRQPFAVSGVGAEGTLKNEFVYSATCYLSGLSLGTTALKEGKTYHLYNRPIADRYYGQSSELIITQTSQIPIQAKRVAFGLKYQISGFTDGEIRIAIHNAPDIVLTPESYVARQDMITLQGSTLDPGSWITDQYSGHGRCIPC